MAVTFLTLLEVSLSKRSLNHEKVTGNWQKLQKLGKGFVIQVIKSPQLLAMTSFFAAT